MLLNSPVARLLSLAALLLSCCAYAEIYRFQDAQGNWHFSDQKPSSETALNLDTLDIKSKTKALREPYLEPKHDQNSSRFIAHNPMPAPVECGFKFEGSKLEPRILMLPAKASVVMFNSDTPLNNKPYHFGCVLGDPNSQPVNYAYLPPFSSYKPMKISQAFNGSYSHQQQPNQYAVDIAMPVGTQIVAARGGLVVSTEGNYSLGGVSSPYFLDKANYVTVLHDDGSYATYAHLLMGRLAVKPGDRIEAGADIGLSGNSGFSSGPHLHFTVRRNLGLRSVSIPFMLKHSDGRMLTPTEGQWLLPTSPAGQ